MPEAEKAGGVLVTRGERSIWFKVSYRCALIGAFRYFEQPGEGVDPFYPFPNSFLARRSTCEGGADKTERILDFGICLLRLGGSLPRF